MGGGYNYADAYSKYTQGNATDDDFGSYVDYYGDLSNAWKDIQDDPTGTQGSYWIPRGATSKSAFGRAHAAENEALKSGTYHGGTDVKPWTGSTRFTDFIKSLTTTEKADPFVKVTGVERPGYPIAPGPDLTYTGKGMQNPLYTAPGSDAGLIASGVPAGMWDFRALPTLGKNWNYTLPNFWNYARGGYTGPGPGPGPGTGPGTGPGDPGTGPSDPGTGPSDPGTGPGDPGTGPGDPGTGPGDPGTGPGDPGTDPSDPGGYTDPGAVVTNKDMEETVVEHIHETSRDTGDMGEKTSKDILDTATTNLLNYDPNVQAQIDIVKKHSGSDQHMDEVAAAQAIIDAATQAAHDADPSAFHGLMDNSGTSKGGPGSYTIPGKPSGAGDWEWNGTEWVSLGVEGGDR